jgi:hypothetical protein
MNHYSYLHKTEWYSKFARLQMVKKGIFQFDLQKTSVQDTTLAIISVPRTTALRQMPGIEAPDLRIDPSERILFDEIN